MCAVMQDDDQYLTTAEAAAYLRLKERKLYELVADGGVPGTKVTGRWLFPRAALDRWLATGLAMPLPEAVPPPIVGGSHDPLLEWTLRQSECGLALLPEGSAAGLRRLGLGQVMAAGIHFHTAEQGSEPANVAAVRATPSELRDAVIVRFARREQGLVVERGNPRGITSFADALERGLIFAVRQTGAGAQLLLESLLVQHPDNRHRLKTTPKPSVTGNDLALSIRAGRGDCGIATRSAAQAFGLDFIPILWEAFDLCMRRRSYFEPAMQAFWHFVATPAFHRQAEELGGYDTRDVGSIAFNA